MEAIVKITFFRLAISHHFIYLVHLTFFAPPPPPPSLPSPWVMYPFDVPRWEFVPLCELRLINDYQKSVVNHFVGLKMIYDKKTTVHVF